MKKILVTMSLLTLGLLPAFAQFGSGGGGPQGPQFDAAMTKLFGSHQTFSAQMEFQTLDPNTNSVTVPGKLSFDHGKARFDMNLAEVRSPSLPANAAEMMKSMGMDTMVAISRPDKKVSYLVYPGLQSYIETTLGHGTNKVDPADFKMESKEISQETLDGHKCVKNRVVVTGKDDVKHECTVWNATDLENFPLKIVMDERGQPATMLFKKVSFQAPAASEFEPASGLTKYTNMQAMIQGEMMKRVGAAGEGLPGKK